MPDLELVSAFLAPRHHELAAAVAAFAGEEIAPLPEPRGDDAGREQARQILARLGAAGWIAHALPAADGGSAHGPDLRACCLIRETLAAASPLADDVFAIQCLASMPLALAGSSARAQRRRYLPAIARGETMTAFAMTEEEAGSDVAAMRTRARRLPGGDGWRLDGTKTLISNAGIADLYLVFAATDPDAGHRGLSCFLVEADRPGVRFAGAQVLAAAHPLGTVVFEDCRLPADALVGTVGEGFALGMRTLDRLRATVAAAACGMAARALDEALAHAASRRQFGRPLADFQLVQAKLADMATELAAARLLTYRAAAVADALTAGAEGGDSAEGGDAARSVTLPSAMAKLYATEAAQRVVDGAVQVLGGRGVLAAHPVDRLYRSVRALRIYEGASEIQQLVIARQVLRRAAAD